MVMMGIVKESPEELKQYKGKNTYKDASSESNINV